MDKNIKDMFSLPSQIDADRKYGEINIIHGIKLLMSPSLNLYLIFKFKYYL